MNREDSPPPSDPRALTLGCSLYGPEAAPLLLVLHGVTASGRYWMPGIVRLADRFRLLIPDLPGFGQSPKPFTDYTMDFFVEAVLGFLARRADAGRPLAILGHSLGGLVALELAVRSPARVDRLVLLSVPRFTDPEAAHRVMLEGSFSYRSLLAVNSIGANWAQVRRYGWRLSARYVGRLPWAVLADARKFSFRSLTSTLEHCLLHYAVDPVLERLPPTIPTLLIHGAEDTVAPVEGVRVLASRPPHPELQVIAGAGHNVFHTHGAECRRLIEAHLGGCLAASTRRA